MPLKEKLEKRLRFLEDLWFLWRGSERQFEAFKGALNTVGRANINKFTLKGEVGKTVDFLDITLENGRLETSVFIKPTDSKRYLNRRSDHTTRTFGGIPFSQFRRAVVISSNDGERQKSVEYMEKKFIDSGYSQTELQESKVRALALDRDEIHTFRLHTPNSTLNILHSTFRTLHPTLDSLHLIKHPTLYSQQFTLYIPHCTLYTLHSTVYPPHSILYPYSTLHTLHSTVYTLHSTHYNLNSTLHIPHSTLHTQAVQTSHIPTFPRFCTFILHFS